MTDAGNDPLEPLFAKGHVEAADGRQYPVSFAIDRTEVAFLRALVAADDSIRRTLEVGCALGFSSHAICTGVRHRPGAHHTIIDPWQSAWFGNAGRDLLRGAGLDDFELIEDFSEFVLPELARDHAAGFDLVFVDGLHTFDHTLLDLFYANRLLRVGGYVVVDDCDWPAVARAVNCLARFPAYRVHAGKPEQTLTRIARAVLGPGAAVLSATTGTVASGRWRFPSMVALKKVAEDERADGWTADF